MSGPKVVRIVTREELIAQGEGSLARVAAALAAWERACDRVDSLTEAEKAAGQARLASLRQMLREDRFAQVQIEVQRELTFLKDDQRERLAKAVATVAAAKRADQRRGEAAKALLAAIDKAGAPLDDDLRTALRCVIAGREDPVAMARGFALLSAADDDGATDRKALAARCKDGVEDRSLAAWLQAQPQEVDPKIERLQAAIDELASLGDVQRAQAHHDRLAVLLAEAPGARRNLLTDSLGIELGQALKTARESAGFLENLRLDLAELAQLDASQEAIFHQRLEAVLAEPLALAALAADVANALVAAKAELAARARREAVLQSLAGLGYEVTEGLSTAWVSEGKVVLRKADRPDYGVEISGGAAAARFQMRAVAFASPDGGPDRSRDRDAETLWCGDVTALKADLAQAGGDLLIEKALAIGATPLKHIGAPGRMSGAEVVRAPGLRTIKPS